jgi:uncharacterized membrane protein YeiB
MKRRSISILWMMWIIALVAINIAAARSVFTHRSVFAEGLLVGALPMACILASAFIRAGEPATNRRYWRGFIPVGVISLGIYLYVASWRWRDVLHPLMRLFLQPVANAIDVQIDALL